MEIRQTKPILLVIFVLFGLVGCYELFFKRQDKANIRRQFHVASGIKIVSFDSHPQQAGFFGREGLQIWAVFQFEEKQFDEYVDNLSNSAVWKPVPFIDYSPDRAEEHTADSLRWRELPLPSWVQDRYRHWKHLSDIIGIRKGRYFCSIIVAAKGEKVVHRDGGYHYKWHYLKRSCSESSGSEESAVIMTFGVLDFEAKKLYAHIAFSG